MEFFQINPIYKKNQGELLENYRPVSTLPIFGKIFEKIIFSRLYSFLSLQNLMYENQYHLILENVFCLLMILTYLYLINAKILYII